MVETGKGYPRMEQAAPKAKKPDLRLVVDADARKEEVLPAMQDDGKDIINEMGTHLDEVDQAKYERRMKMGVADIVDEELGRTYAQRESTDRLPAMQQHGKEIISDWGQSEFDRRREMTVPQVVDEELTVPTVPRSELSALFDTAYSMSGKPLSFRIGEVAALRDRLREYDAEGMRKKGFFQKLNFVSKIKENRDRARLQEMIEALHQTTKRSQFDIRMAIDGHDTTQA